MSPRRALPALLVLLAACAGSHSTTSPDGGAAPGAISVDEVHQALIEGRKDFLLLNVHVPVAGDIPGTDKDIPYNDVAALSAFIGSDLDKKVVVYCMSNAMSTQARDSLLAKGYRAVRYLDGGFTAWKAAGYSTDPSPDAGSDLPDAGPSATITVGELHDALTKGAKDFLLINVHTPYAGDIPGTDKDIPYNTVDAIASFVGNNLDTKVVVYCMSNSMSSQARSGLVQRGYRAVRYLDGGMTLWMVVGYSLIYPPDGGGPTDAGPADAAAATPLDASIPADAGPTLGVISVKDLYDALSDGGTKDFLLINVHTPFAGDIPGTDTDIAYTDPDGLAKYLGPDLDAKVVVYCMSNYMSTIAGNALVAKGYRAVRYLDGGMGAWQAAGYPLNK